MRKLLQNWQDWGFDRQTVLAQQDALDRRNWRTLGQVGGIIAFVSLVGLAVFLWFGESMQHNALCVAGLLLSGAMAFTAGHICRAERLPRHGVGVAVQALYITLVSACILYQGTVDSPDHYAVLAVWWLCFFQIVFTFSPSVTLVLVLVYMGCFWALSLSLKETELAAFDIAHSLMAALGGQYISWTGDRLRLKSLVDESQLRRANAALFRASTTDALTSLKNRRCVLDVLAAMCELAQSDGGSVTCAIIDLDNFKSYNDTYGHPEGDRLLAAFGKRLGQLADEYALTAGRIGGEEFMLLWRATADRDEASMVGVMHAIPGSMPEPWQTARRFTLSVGCCTLTGEELRQPDRLYARADEALYHAKNTGRDRACRYDAAKDAPAELPLKA